MVSIVLWVTSPHAVPGMAQSSATGNGGPQWDHRLARMQKVRPFGCIQNVSPDRSTDVANWWISIRFGTSGATSVAPLGADVTATARGKELGR